MAAMLRSAILRNSSSVRSRYWLLRAEPRSGAVDLQHEAGFDDGAVLGLHHIGERFHVGVLARVVQVDDEAREDAGRRRGHEHVGGLRFARRGFEVARDRGRARCGPCSAAGRRSRETATSLKFLRAGEVRMRQQVAPDHDVAALLGGARVRLDAADPMPDVGGVGRLAHLAVADDVDRRRRPAARRYRRPPWRSRPQRRRRRSSRPVPGSITRSISGFGRGRLPVCVVRIRSLLVFIRFFRCGGRLWR